MNLQSHDMLVRLYEHERWKCDEAALRTAGITLKRTLGPDIARVQQFIRTEFSDGWANEASIALYRAPSTCFIAVKDKKVVGFACYDATAKGMFGPTGIQAELRGSGVGAALLVRCLRAMWHDGYVYGVIGGVDDARGFYEKVVGAEVIERSHPGIYAQMIAIDETEAE